MAQEHPETDLSFTEASGLTDPCDEIRRGRVDVAITLEENAHPQDAVGMRVLRRMRYCVLTGYGSPFFPSHRLYTE